jgi:hypothetical protein
MIQFTVYDSQGLPLTTAKPFVDRFTMAGPLTGMEPVALGNGLFEFDPLVNCVYQISTGALPPYYIGLSPYGEPIPTHTPYVTTPPPGPPTP